jgi:hypothetical protein
MHGQLQYRGFQQEDLGHTRFPKTNVHPESQPHNCNSTLLYHYRAVQT